MLLTTGCTRDDICDQTTQTTPLLVIQFNDINNPNEPKVVPSLAAYALVGGAETLVAPEGSVSEVAIPFRSSHNSTQYKLVFGNGTGTQNADTITFQYTTVDQYLNRACAFKTTYDSVTATITDEENTNWLLQATVNFPLIEDETNAHLTVLH
ncbi:MAG: DUF6452 family protein [Marinirhabdus sp.]